MSLANENCPKCGHTLEYIGGQDLQCFNANCDLTEFDELREYYKNHNMSFHDIKR